MEKMKKKWRNKLWKFLKDKQIDYQKSFLSTYSKFLFHSYVRPHNRRRKPKSRGEKARRRRQHPCCYPRPTFRPPSKHPKFHDQKLEMLGHRRSWSSTQPRVRGRHEENHKTVTKRTTNNALLSDSNEKSRRFIENFIKSSTARGNQRWSQPKSCH